MTIPGIDPAPDQHRAYIFDVIIPILEDTKGLAPLVPTALIILMHTS
jgi:hypothetical protein